MNKKSFYDKPWLSITDQINLLEEKGMIINDYDKAKSSLSIIGYYRLSAYWHVFRQTAPHNKQVLLDSFHANTTFEDALNLYLFDKKLRLHILDALESIEVAIKVDIAHTLGEVDQFAHLRTGFSNKRALSVSPTGQSKSSKWLSTFKRLEGRSKEDFVKHFQSNYSGELPIWIAVEIWDFGSLSTFYSIILRRFQTKIAAKYGLSDPEVFASWLRSLNYLRNLVAHHSRLWNRNIVDQPKMIKSLQCGWWQAFNTEPHLRSKPFLLFAILRHMTLQISPQTEWHKSLETILLDFPLQDSDLKRTINDIGIPRDWKAWW